MLAIPDAVVYGTGFRGILLVDAAGDPLGLAERTIRGCGQVVARVVAVLAQVVSARRQLLQAVVAVGLEQVLAGESFAVRVHKRGNHGYTDPTPVLERETGGALWDALARRDARLPQVDLVHPDITIDAEALGPHTLVGVYRRAWRAEKVAHERVEPGWGQNSS